MVGTELSIEYSPYESDQIDLFTQRKEILRTCGIRQMESKGFSNKLVTMEIHGVTELCLGNNPIYDNGSVVGRATSGDFGFRVNKSIALGMVKPELAKVGQKLKIDILGKMHEVSIVKSLHMMLKIN